MNPGKVITCVYVSLLLFLIALVVETSSGQGIGSLDSGVVVESVLKHSEAEKAGIQEGDVLLRWVRGDMQGEIRSPFDLNAIEVEQPPRGIVRLEGLHGNETKTWPMGQDRWGLEVRPNFPITVLTLYRQAQTLATAGNLSEVVERWHEIIDERDISNPQWLRAWLLFHLAGLQANARNWKESDQAYQEALEISPAGPDAVTQIHLAWGRTFIQRNDWEHADDHLHKALTVQEASGSRTLARALILDDLGDVAKAFGDLSKADDYYQQAKRIREELAPDSLSLAVSLNKVAWVANDRSEMEKGMDAAHRALELAERIAPDSLTVANALRVLGVFALNRGNLTAASDYCGRSLEIFNKLSPASLELAEALDWMSEFAFRRGDLAKAGENASEALAIQEKLVPGSLAVAVSLTVLGVVAHQRGDLDKAEEYHSQALAIREKFAPGSLDTAKSVANLGNVAYGRDDLVHAEEYYHQYLAITEKLVPQSQWVASAFRNLGLVAQERGDLAQAEDYFQQFLAISEKVTPDSRLVLGFSDLGAVALQRGDLAKAEKYFHQALAIGEKFVPGSLRVALCLNNLGDLARVREDLTGAQEYYREALQLREKLVPGSLIVAESLSSLAVVALQRGDSAKAMGYGTQALTIREKLAPGSLSVADSLNSLGLGAFQRGDLAGAEENYRRALAICTKLAPTGRDMAWNLNSLSILLQGRDKLEEAERYSYEALAIWDKLAPGSANQADALAGLASIKYRQHQLDMARQFYDKAVAALESQNARLGGSEEIRAGFRANHGKYYQDYLSILLQQGDVDAGFQVLERSRARTLLEMLASSHLDIRRGADPALLQRERTLRESVAARRDRRIRLLSDKKDDQQVKAVEKEIRDLSNEYQEVERQFRSNSPAYAALTQPQPLSAKGVQELLDPDSLLLEFSLGQERSYVFAVTHSSLSVYGLASRAEIESVVRHFYDAVSALGYKKKGETEIQQRARWATAAKSFPTVQATLSRMLLEPVAAELVKNKRVVIVGDGALAYVPFATLLEPPRFGLPLVVRHEIVNLPSASVLNLLRNTEEGRQTATRAVAVLADPVFDKQDARVKGAKDIAINGHVRSADAQDVADVTVSAGVMTRAAMDAGFSTNGPLRFPRLPFSRQEAEAIFAEVPRRQALKALDFLASRTTATSPKLSQYRIAHFATHGILDGVHPELSGLVFSLVDQRGNAQNGFLGLEEIYNLNLPLDLVVLSACKTGLGKVIGGEGMTGLTRGFMYAGASRVVASLWNVNDAATAELMGRFYRAMLRDGLSPSMALRRAQLAMRKQKRWAEPYYWGAFVMQGDWRPRR